MIYLLALLPATALTVAGYFVWFLAERSQGTLRTFGRFLGFWAFTLAALVILAALFAAAHGHHRMHGRHCPWPPQARPGAPAEPPPDLHSPGPSPTPPPAAPH
jgi:hypothetical protein